MHVSEAYQQLRNFITISEGLDPSANGEVLHEQEIPTCEKHDAIVSDLDRLVIKLRSFMESQGGEYALGFEAGMQRAADMIENVIETYSLGRQHLG